MCWSATLRGLIGLGGCAVERREVRGREEPVEVEHRGETAVAPTDPGNRVRAPAHADIGRRIESIDLWTGLTGIYRPREGSDSWGASVFLYKTINPLRLRLAGWADLYGQELGVVDARTVHPHGYVEFSGRVTPTFFLLPRLGYDGYYSNLLERPADLTNVDDDGQEGLEKDYDIESVSSPSGVTHVTFTRKGL